MDHAEQKAAIEAEPLELMGRTFLLTPEQDVTFEQYGWLQNAAIAAGMGEELRAVLDPKIDAIRAGDEMGDALAMELSEAILTRAFQGRAYLDILAGLLVEEGREWERSEAEANREFFAKIKGPDIRKLHGIIIQTVIGFFLSGLLSSKTSPSSSGRKLAAVAAMAGISLRPKTSGPSVGATDSETTET